MTTDSNKRPAKRYIKPILITLASLLGAIVIGACIVLGVVFSPKKLASLVHNQAEKYITCRTEIGEVGLTLFKTFPFLGVSVKDLTLINPMDGAQSDTLLYVNEFVGEMNFSAWWNDNELIFTEICLDNGIANIFVNKDGKANYDIMSADEQLADTSDSGLPFVFVNINSVRINNIAASYNDLSGGMRADVKNLTALVSGHYKQSDVMFHVATEPFDVKFGIDTDSMKVNASIADLALIFDSQITDNDIIIGKIKAEPFFASAEYDGDKYLDQAELKLDIPFSVRLSINSYALKDALVSVNGLSFNLNGQVEIDGDNNHIDVSYKFASWPFEKIMAIVPTKFSDYTKAIDISGEISSSGTVVGVYNEKQFPELDMNVKLHGDKARYAGVQLAVKGYLGDFHIVTDMKNDVATYVEINSLTVKTGRSSLTTQGIVTNILSNPYINLSSVVDANLGELMPLVPADMKVSMKGRVAGKLNSSLSMSQLEKLQLDRMRLSGQLALSDLDVVYDTISIKTDYSEVEFSLPNTQSSSKGMGFCAAKIDSKSFDAVMKGGYFASMKNSHVVVEMSNVITAIGTPFVNLSLDAAALQAKADTINVDLLNAALKVALAPQKGAPDRPDIKLTYKSGAINSGIGFNALNVGSVDLNAHIVNDVANEKMWIVKGYTDMRSGLIKMANLSHPIEIPTLKLNFDPDKLDVKEGSIRIDNSDFKLSGTLGNIFSYINGDSLLRGTFDLRSGSTDLVQLMNLTNGIGSEDGVSKETSSGVVSGPYMVPKGVDLTLSVDVSNATFGADTANNIKGNIHVKDGILVFDAVGFTTAAAKMQLTALYKTPRKNHLFLGLDYHMLDVEIEELLRMIPDVDSIMPMLRSFSGKGEFHIAAETYLDSMYNLKKSTLRGVSSVKGKDLVLMDGQTFSEIAKMLKFSKKTRNKVDSLSAEFTIFKEEVDIYPFMIVMDKYKAIVSGRHNLDMSFDYHISVVECPLPVKLGLNVNGNLDDLKFKVVKRKYDDLYRPSQRRELQNKQLELREMIRNSLIDKVQKEAPSAE